MARDDRIPTSRWARAAKVGRLAATQGAKQAGTRAMNLTRDEQAAQDAMARRQVETGKQIVPELAKLRDAVPKVSFKDMKKVLEDEYGDMLDNVFESFDPSPIAAASIGQV